MLVKASRWRRLSLFCVAMEAVAYCFNVAVRVTSCQSESEHIVRSMPSHFPPWSANSSLKSELRALHTVHLSTSEVRLPRRVWQPVWNLREIDKNFQTSASNVLWILRFRLRECHFQRIWRSRHCVTWQKTPMRMLLSSCTAQKSASERLGTFSSQPYERDIPLCKWDLIMWKP